MSSYGFDKVGSKRSRSRSPPPWKRPEKVPRRDDRQPLTSSRDWDRENTRPSGYQHRNERGQARINHIQEDEKEREWVAQEDTFVLKQAKKKAEIRVKEGRAKPIDWLAVTL